MALGASSFWIWSSVRFSTDYEIFSTIFLMVLNSALEMLLISIWVTLEKICTRSSMVKVWSLSPIILNSFRLISFSSIVDFYLYAMTDRIKVKLLMGIWLLSSCDSHYSIFRHAILQLFPFLAVDASWKKRVTSRKLRDYRAMPYSYFEYLFNKSCFILFNWMVSNFCCRMVLQMETMWGISNC